MTAHAQTSLFPGAPRPRLKPERASFASFEKFHRTHPEIYRLLVEMAREVKKRRNKYSIKTLWEVLRWKINIGMSKTGDFKLNNNHHAYYARLIMRQEPDLKGFFTLRERKRQ